MSWPQRLGLVALVLVAGTRLVPLVAPSRDPGRRGPGGRRARVAIAPNTRRRSRIRGGTDDRPPELLPAVDVADGRAVQLQQGGWQRLEFGDPVEAALARQ